MANKFTQSVLERQALETAKQKKESVHLPEPSSPTALPAKRELPVPTILPLQESIVPPGPSSPSLSDLPVEDMNTYLVREKVRSAKNKTFYLDIAVIDGIKAAAKKQKVAESKLVNDILTKILGCSRD